MSMERVGGSFRDPAGFVYRSAGRIHRRINVEGAADYDRLMASGLYGELANRGWLVPHREIEPDSSAHRTLVPEQIPYVTYPYEWSFGQLKDAAILTLEIQQASLSHGMSLKDASAYNVQFVGSRPVFIDTLSFEVYQDGTPWVAYRQFCQHFLAPLFLMARVDVRLRRLLSGYVDGVPLDLASAMLPARSWLSAGPLLHVHLHARGQRQHRDDGRQQTPVRVPALPKGRLIALIDGLKRAVERCAMPPVRTEWGHYYDDTNYSTAAMAAKESLVAEMVEASGVPGGVVHDLGANTGRFSQLVASPGRYVVAHDVDELAVERHYQDAKAKRLDRVLPLVLDLTQPSPALGWGLEERESTMARLGDGTVLALALVHHLAISNNVPLPELARFFARIARALIVEFVPKDDSQVRRLLATRQDIFPDYTTEHFEAAMAVHFEIQRAEHVPDTVRTLYLMRRR
jgi:ribosomal protein L11 methylase PrmA